MEPDAVEIRVLGCLLEKQRTTPDTYPLSLNALRLACNQSTNREPVVEYGEATVRDAVRRLAKRGWARLASGPGSRAPKYRQIFDKALDLGPAETALLAVLMLRGPQTPGELKQRSDRLYAFTDLSAVHETLELLIERGHIDRLDRRPGQKEERYVQLLGGNDDTYGSPSVTAAAPGPAEDPGTGSPSTSLEARLDRLEQEVAELRQQLRDPQA